ncbi:hypothetical protein [Nitrospirillum bahiense]|uniref:Uncharacterized protein n=1 Tax=Nitrospirillum amazonense TaxID=28077 RepID=A0A560F241_9PROT|nr:hypothetical protein [Nitrospirillum amazonense]TWB15575.1 hypothetical protein FBZ88_12928 [Nitrospirillum amazonense]
MSDTLVISFDPQGTPSGLMGEFPSSRAYMEGLGYTYREMPRAEAEALYYPDPEPTTCSVCGAAPFTLVHCDQDDGAWCTDCFDGTPCGKGHHGEGCPTMVHGINSPADPA